MAQYPAGQLKLIIASMKVKSDRTDEAALHEWRPFAEQGDAYAQTGLGSLYDDGRGVPQDYNQARQWYEKAAAHGYALAEAGLGRLYLFGKGGSPRL